MNHYLRCLVYKILTYSKLYSQIQDLTEDHNKYVTLYSIYLAQTYHEFSA